MRYRRHDPSEAILSVARVEQADLIVTASHARGGIQRLWYGSVASRALQQATLPLFLIRSIGHGVQERHEPASLHGGRL